MNNSSRIYTLCKDRLRILQGESPSYQKFDRITEHSALQNITPLYNKKITQNDYNYAMYVLEHVADTPIAKTVASAIAINILPGVEEDVIVSGNIFGKINEECKEILEKRLNDINTCSRIISNETMLESRFNVDRIVTDISSRPVEDIVYELCTMIDTYNVALPVKLSVALENIPYILSKNYVWHEDDSKLLDSILEYFLMRDMYISDVNHKLYKQIIKETEVLDNTPTRLTTALESADSNYFSKKLISTMESNTFDTSHLLGKVLNISTEEQAASYMEEVRDLVASNKLTKEDEGRLYSSIQNIPNVSTISKDFVDMKKRELFDIDRFDTLTRDCITPLEQPISEKIEEDIITNKRLVTFSEEVYATSNDVESLINKFKSEQDKSPNAIKRFIEKLHTKSPESIIDETPSIMTIIRTGILLGVAASCPVGPIIAGFAGLCSWLLSRDINDRKASKFLTAIREEKKKTKNKIDKTSSDKKKQELQHYLDCLENCDKKVSAYLDSLVDEDHSDPDAGDDWDFDFGDELESAVSKAADIINKSNSILEDNIDVDLNKMIRVCTENDLLIDAVGIMKKSSINKSKYLKALKEAYNELESVKDRTAVLYMINVLESDNEASTNESIQDVVTCYEANQFLKEANECIINEVNINSLKLALQASKAKMKDINTKWKSLWQSADANASNLMRGIENAMTSDRREGIIKGSIIPSFSKCCKSAMALGAVGIFGGPYAAAIAAVGSLGVSAALNKREKQLLMDEIDTELKVVEKQIEIAQGENDMNQYRFLLNYQKKLTREYQRIKLGMRVSGRDIPRAGIPGRS